MSHYRPVILIAALAFYLATALKGQSLWNENLHARPLWADPTASGIGDILTVIIDESNQIENDEQTTLDKESSLSALISNFNLLPNLFNTLPQVQAEQTREFDGNAQYDKDNSFRTRVSVLVVDVMPNGNLLIEGTRRLFVDGETKLVKITGMVRVFDIARDNTVRSASVANASISYEGDGFITRSTGKGWFSRLLDIVWPF